MKTRIFIGLFGLLLLATSCDKNKEHYGTYDATETRTYDGSMMAGDVDLSDQNYLLTVEANDKEKITLKNIYEHGTEVVADVNVSAVTIQTQSLDGFLEIEGNGTIGNGLIDLNYSVITPDGNVICDFNAGKVK